MAIVSICRGSKSGGQALAECVAQHLHYPIVGREILQTTAEGLGVSEADLVRHFHQPRVVWDRQAASRRVYIVAMQATLAEHAASGNLVYHGIAGQMLLRGLPGVMRVRLIKPLADRLRTLMESEGLGKADAKRRIREADAGRARWVKRMYGEHIDDPRLYDLVLNLTATSVPAACSVIRAGLAQPEFAVTDTVRTALDDFRLGCRVRLALVTDPDTRGFPLDVRAHAGLVEISGSAPALATGETGDRIATIARAVPGVRRVQLKVQWFDPYP